MIVVGAEWPARPLIRAQLIEQGLDVVAVDEWPIPRLYRRQDMKPRAMVVDLKGLPRPREVLDEIRFVVPPSRVVVIHSLGTVTPEQIVQHGYRLLTRPLRIRDVVGSTMRILDSSQPI